MAPERLLRILSRLNEAGGTPRLCAISAEITGMTGAGIMLMSGDIPRGSLCTSDAVSSVIEELQFTLGEGPCVDAFNDRRPVVEGDLEDPDVPRWPAFTPAALEAGVRAVFGFPIQIGVTRLGALNLYRDEPGPMSDEQYADASVMAEVSARTVIEAQAGAPAGTIDGELTDGANFQLVVHQASGMVSAQLGISVGDALIRLRAYAFAHECSLADVGTRVVRRELRFDQPSPASGDLP